MDNFVFVIFRKVDLHMVELFFEESNCSECFSEYDLIYPGEYDWRGINLSFVINDYLKANYTDNSKIRDEDLIICDIPLN